MSNSSIIDLYERHAHAFDRERSRSLQEKSWLDRFLERVPPSGTILDIGCGMGEPIARYCLDAGFHVVGIDSSPSLIAMCRARFPRGEWLVADMRELALDRRFDGLLAWDSFFHLSGNDQRGMFARFASHARPGAPLMFTSGTSEGEVVGSFAGEPLYHASLDSSEYGHLLSTNGFSVHKYVPNESRVSRAYRVAGRLRRDRTAVKTQYYTASSSTASARSAISSPPGWLRHELGRVLTALVRRPTVASTPRLTSA